VPNSCSFLPSGRAAGGGPKESARVEAYLSAEEEDEMPEELREGLAQRVGEVFRELAFDSTSHRSTITTPAIATAPLGWNDRMLVDGANNAVPKMNRVPPTLAQSGVDKKLSARAQTGRGASRGRLAAVKGDGFPAAGNRGKGWDDAPVNLRYRQR
jgi:hypothetical protein